MQLDWITLYDYMTVFSRSEIKSKINKFYESFYPLKFKKTGKKTCELKEIERVGLLGIVASYIQQTLFALEAYLEAQQYLFFEIAFYVKVGLRMMLSYRECLCRYKRKILKCPSKQRSQFMSLLRCQKHTIAYMKIKQKRKDFFRSKLFAV